MKLPLFRWVLPTLLGLTLALPTPAQAQAQTPAQTPAADSAAQARLAAQVLDAFSEVQAFRTLFLQRNRLKIQLTNLEKWRRAGDIGPADLQGLAAAYEQVRQHTNAFTTQVGQDLGRVSQLRDLRQARGQLLTQLTGAYQTELNAAGAAYDTGFLPRYEQAAARVRARYGSTEKGIFDHLLPFLLRAAPDIAEVVFSVAQGRFRAAYGQLSRLAVGLAVARLDANMRLPPWADYVKGPAPTTSLAGGPAPAATPGQPATAPAQPAQPAPAAAREATETALREAEQAYGFVYGSVALRPAGAVAPADTALALHVESFALGTGLALPYFQTLAQLPLNYQFRVALAGYENAAVLAYDYDAHRWQQLYPKASKTIRDQSLRGARLALPLDAGQGYTILPDATAHPAEAFLLLLSNAPLAPGRLAALTQAAAPDGPEILRTVADTFGAGQLRAPWLVAPATPQLTTIRVVGYGESGIVVPLYLSLQRQP